MLFSFFSKTPSLILSRNNIFHGEWDQGESTIWLQGRESSDRSPLTSACFRMYRRHKSTLPQKADPFLFNVYSSQLYKSPPSLTTTSEIAQNPFSEVQLVLGPDHRTLAELRRCTERTGLTGRGERGWSQSLRPKSVPCWSCHSTWDHFPSLDLLWRLKWMGLKQNSGH